jgi:hypothetical protein
MRVQVGYGDRKLVTRDTADNPKRIGQINYRSTRMLASGETSMTSHSHPANRSQAIDVIQKTPQPNK